MFTSSVCISCKESNGFEDRNKNWNLSSVEQYYSSSADVETRKGQNLILTLRESANLSRYVKLFISSATSLNRRFSYKFKYDNVAPKIKTFPCQIKNFIHCITNDILC